MERLRWLQSVPLVVASLRSLRRKEPSPLFGYTRCNGGERRWLLCPRCFKKVAKLYRPLDEVLLHAANVTN